MADLNIGGQAVIEGVMIRSKERVATAVRIPSGEIVIKAEEYHPLAARYKALKLPVLRGAVAFAEMLVIGIRTLNFSAEIAMHEAEKDEAAKEGHVSQKKPRKSNSLMLALSALFAIGFGVLVFFFTPLAITNLFHFDKNAVGFNLIAGVIRLTMFVLYVWGISFFGEFKRIFQYHGAEHKSIYAYEMGDELTPSKAALHTRFHPRCGTSFILIVAILAMLIYAISDTVYQMLTGFPPALLKRFLVHLMFLPVVAGTSYELLKLSGKTRENPITKILIKPGLWLQKITTREPSPEQLEVAIAALKASLGLIPATITEKTPVS